jgi:hypothetical protein
MWAFNPSALDSMTWPMNRADLWISRANLLARYLHQPLTCAQASSGSRRGRNERLAPA